MSRRKFSSDNEAVFKQVTRSNFFDVRNDLCRFLPHSIGSHVEIDADVKIGRKLL